MKVTLLSLIPGDRGRIWVTTVYFQVIEFIENNIYPAQYPCDEHPYWTIPHLTIYVQFQSSAPTQEVEVEAIDGR